MVTLSTQRSAGPLWVTVLMSLPGLALIVSSLLKFAGVPAVTEQMAALGFAGGRLLLIATLELLSAALFLWPRTRSIGLLLVGAYLGGAICAHVAHGELPEAMSPAVLLALAWLGTWLRHPEMLWSFQRGPVGPEARRSSRNLTSEARG